MGRNDIQAACQQVLDAQTSDPQKVPGLVFAAVDKKGHTITANASGKRGLGSKHEMDLDTVFWIASCTKIITGIVCMQLVEQGKVQLDDHRHLYQHCPELDKVQVLQDDLTLVPKKKDITLRMLLTHTAGFGYDFSNQKLVDYYRPVGLDFFDGNVQVLAQIPLVNQPGEKWEYGINIDWAGIYCERATGKSLNDLMIDGVFKPLGLENITMFPTASMKRNLASMHQRWPGSQQLHSRDHPVRIPLLDVSDATKKDVLNSGGAGCFATATDFTQILATLLNDGTSPKTGKQVLKPETVQTMFTNQIPHMPDFAYHPLGAAKLEMTNPVPELSPQEGNPPQGWGLTFHLVLTPGPFGRAPNTASWAGLANCFYWIDREKGVAAFIAGQILPFGDMSVLTAAAQCEGTIYANL